MRVPDPVELHHQHLYEGEPEEDLIAALEPDQLEEVMNQPLLRRRLGVWTQVGLWLLRVFVLLVTAMVGYVFVVTILRGGG
ncbi:MAG: hypothetical protein ACREP9_23300 [Candidatus Dormibacteraceae bacterium]